MERCGKMLLNIAFCALQKVVKVKTPQDLWMAKNISDMKLWFLSESKP